jgi:cob(I)alamin adenosyltransferase
VSGHLLTKGLVTVYSGPGRGKTTAALGLALRVLGWGGSVCVVQFIKGYPEIGEAKFAADFGDRFVLRQFAQDDTRSITEDDVLARRAAAEAALEYAEAVVSAGEYDLVILDEVNNALHYGLVSLPRVLELIRAKPTHVEIVLTGRGAPPEIVQAADYATEMLLIKHPFEEGIGARRGIDL